MGRAFRWSAHLHKKAGFLRAGEAGNERALRGGIGSVLSAPIFAPLRLAAASFSVRRGGLRQKKSPCQGLLRGLRAVWSVAAVLAVPRWWWVCPGWRQIAACNSA